MKRLVITLAILSGLLLTAMLVGTAQEQPKANRSVRELPKSKVKFGPVQDPKTTIAEVFDQVYHRYDLPVHIDEHAFKADGVADVTRIEPFKEKPLPEMTAPLGEVLNRILERIPAKSGAMYTVQRGRITITTTAAFRAELGRSEEDSTPIGTLVQGSWSQATLTEALHQISEDTEANIVIDPQAGEKAGAKAITARLRNVPLKTALRVLADMAGLAVIQIDNVYYVSSAEHLQNLSKEQEKQGACAACKPPAPSTGGKGATKPIPAAAPPR